MQFHEYRTMRNQVCNVDENKYPDATAYRSKMKGMSSAVYRKLWIDDLPKADKLSALDLDTALAALCEDIWVDHERPFYNVWPLAVELARKVSLNLPFSALGIPSDVMLLRFPKGLEPFDVRNAMLFWPRNEGTRGACKIFCYRESDWHRLSLSHSFDPNEDVQQFLDRLVAQELAPELGETQPKLGEFLIRLCVFICLLANDKDFVTPIVLSKDQSKYDATTDEEARKWLEDRAARRMGRGFDVGKKLQLAKDTSPHWRNPHLCLFWTGEGRSKPVIKMRSGAIIQSVSMAEVPTGYLGPERNEDDELKPEATPRDGISKSRRYDIMKRDGFRCQLCGKTQEQGVVLHIDHKVALANGGSNLDDNLWTLCEPCNLGKSAKSL